MDSSFERALTEVWRQSLVENAKVVGLGTERYPVRLTPKCRLQQVDFVFDGNEIRGLEQNPQTKARTFAALCGPIGCSFATGQIPESFAAASC